MKISGGQLKALVQSDKQSLQVVPSQQILPQPAKEQEITKEVKKEELSKAVDKLNRAMGIFKNNEVRFSIHEKTKHMMVQVIKEDTGEVIAEYPPKKILDLVAQLQEMVGLIVDKRL